MKILLLEDDYNYNESIKEYLELLGYEVDAFFDGESALDAIMQKCYYLFLLDVKVPKLSGHELGCNDYLKKPFELKELELRVRELIKKHYQTSSDGEFRLSCGFVFNFESGELKNEGKTVSLTSKELDLVRFLIRRKNTFCDIELIRENVWEGKEISYADIRMYIRKIRLKVDEEFIKSSRGLGYRIDVIA